MAHVQRISPCLWFDDQAEEAAQFYVSVFRNSRLGRITRYGAAGARVSGRPKGSVMTVEFVIEGIPRPERRSDLHIHALMVKCDTQQEIDVLWDKLSAGGEPGQCGWLKDRYGLSWQIVSPIWDDMVRDGDAQRSERVMEAILRMTRPDLRAIQKAYEGQ